MNERRRVPPVTKMKRRPNREGVKGVSRLNVKHNKVHRIRAKGVVVATDGKGVDGPSEDEISDNWSRIFGKGKYD